MQHTIRNRILGILGATIAVLSTPAPLLAVAQQPRAEASIVPAKPDANAQTRTVPPARVRAETPNAVIETGLAVRYSTPLRWAELVAVMTLIGAVIFRLVILQHAALPVAVAAESADRVRRLANAALALFIVATLTRVAAQSNLVPDAATSRTTAVMLLIQGTRWGHGWLVGLIGAGMALIGFVFARASIVGWFVAGVGVAAIATAEGLTGHAGASPTHLPLAIAVDVAHVLGAGGWLGGLTALWLCGLPSLRALDDVERARSGSRLVRSFHGAAVECIALVLASACIAAWLRLGAVADFWATFYGRILLLKIAFALVLLGFGWHRRRTAVIPEWDSATKFRFRRTAAGELVVGALVLAATAVLIGTALPAR